MPTGYRRMWKPRKSKPTCPLWGDEGVGDAGFLRVEFRPHLGRPFYGHPLQVQEHVQVGVKDDEVVGIADDAGGRFGRSGLA